MLTVESENHISELEEQIRRDITAEIYRAAKVPDINWLKKALVPLVAAPVNRFSRLISEFDASVMNHSFVNASRLILKKRDSTDYQAKIISGKV